MSDPLQPPSPSAPPPSLVPEDEFAGIRSRASRHPALALGAAALALFIIFHVRADVAYCLSTSEPADLGDATATFGPARPPGAPAARRPATGVAPEALAQAANHYVRVRGTPDRESALELDTKGSWVFTQFFRILGTGSRLFVHRRENPLPGFRAEEDVFEGRLIRFADLSFETAIRGYTASHVSATHFFSPVALRAAIVGATAGSATTIVDLAGDPVALGPSDLLAIDLALPEQLRVAFPRDKFRNQAAARAEIEKRGGAVISEAEATPTPTAPPSSPSPSPSPTPAGLTPATDDRVVLVVRFPAERRQAALGELGDLDPRIEIRAARRTLKVRLGDLRDGGDALLVQPSEAGAAPDRLPLADIPAIRTLAAVQIPTDAWLLIENDHPRDHVQAVIFAGVLLAFALINLLGLARALKRS